MKVNYLLRHVDAKIIDIMKNDRLEIRYNILNNRKEWGEVQEKFGNREVRDFGVECGNQWMGIHIKEER